MCDIFKKEHKQNLEECCLFPLFKIPEDTRQTNVNIYEGIQKIITLFLCSVLFFAVPDSKAQITKPNILVISTDQQSAKMLSTAGNKWVDTPNLDQLSARGVRFEKAYVTNPVCSPSRFSMQTGLFPSAIGMRHNASPINTEKNEQIIRNAMGHTFRAAGYETVYGGKIHLPGHTDDIVPYGYSLLTENSREVLAQKSAEYILDRSQDEPPFFMFLSFLNPHDICYEARRVFEPDSPLAKSTPDQLTEAMEKPKGVSDEEFFANYCPPLPDNYEPTAGEPEAIQNLIAEMGFRKGAREQWAEKEWRMHRWAYARLTEKVDRQIGMVLDALEKSGLQENTIVAFTSDHGDMDASHRLEHKDFFYEESARVPFIFAGKDILSDTVNDQDLVSTGLDLYPTLLDLADIDIPEELPGMSLEPCLLSKRAPKKRKYLFIENRIGYMVTDGRFKYSWYDKTNEEMFVDLKNDPGEMKNLIPQVHKNQSKDRKKYVELKKELGLRLKKRHLYLHGLPENFN